MDGLSIGLNEGENYKEILTICNGHLIQFNTFSF